MSVSRLGVDVQMFHQIADQLPDINGLIFILPSKIKEEINEVIQYHQPDIDRWVESYLMNDNRIDIEEQNMDCSEDEIFKLYRDIGSSLGTSNVGDFRGVMRDHVDNQTERMSTYFYIGYKIINNGSGN